MSDTTIRKFITEYLESAKLMQVATSSNNRPWVCSVYFAFDKNLHLFWLSSQDRRHSQEIQTNPSVAGSIVLPHTPGDKVRGIQFQGRARELEGISDGLKLYAKRFGMDQTRVDAIVANTDGHVCYEIAPTLFVFFDELNFSDQPRQEYIV